MRISAQNFYVVSSCLIAGIVLVSALILRYNHVLSLQENHEENILAQRDIKHIESMVSQWFVNVDLFFGYQQSYLASGIGRQVPQLQTMLQSLEKNNLSALGAESPSNIISTLGTVNTSIQQLAISEKESELWNQALDGIDNASIDIVEKLELLNEEFTALAKESKQLLDNARQSLIIEISIGLACYVGILLMIWLWTTKTLVRPLETLNAITQKKEDANDDHTFSLENAPQEILQLSYSFDDYTKKLDAARKRAEQRTETINKQKAEIEKNYEELKATRSQLVTSDKLAAVGQLSAGIAHEINNPNGFVKNNLNMLKDYSGQLKASLTAYEKATNDFQNEIDKEDIVDELTAQLKEHELDYVMEDLDELVSESLEGTIRIENIVRGLKAFCRVDTEEPEQLDVNQCIENTLSLLEHQIKDKSHLDLRLSELPATMGFPSNFSQVMMNMLINANQAIAEKGDIVIKTEHIDNDIVIKIGDNGCGIAKDTMNKIFDPFFTTRDVGDGTGLGLSISHGIIEKHGGTIAVGSEVGKGTLFTIKIPVIDLAA